MTNRGEARAGRRRAKVSERTLQEIRRLVAAGVPIKKVAEPIQKAPPGPIRFAPGRWVGPRGAYPIREQPAPMKGGTVRILVQIDAELHARLKRVAADRRSTLQDLVVLCLEEGAARA